MLTLDALDVLLTTGQGFSITKFSTGDQQPRVVLNGRLVFEKTTALNPKCAVGA